MRGKVSRYKLDRLGIVNILEGNMLPRRPAILACLVVVTFVGCGKLPKRFLREIFRVRRKCVLDALLWLKIHNQKYYGEMDIDNATLNALPNNDVPVEVMSVIQQSTDVELLDTDHNGYAPTSLFSK
jgi:hypothetical protein